MESPEFGVYYLNHMLRQVQYDHPSVPVYYNSSLPVPRPQLSYITPPTVPNNVRYHQNVLVPANPYLHEAIPEWLKVYFKVRMFSFVFCLSLVHCCCRPAPIWTTNSSGISSGYPS